MRIPRRATILVVAFGTIAACTAQPMEAQQMNSRMQAQELAVRQMIDYDAVLASIDPASGVAFEWPAVFLPEGWEEVADDVYPAAPFLVERKAIYRKADVTVTFELFVSGNGPKPALGRLIDTMLATSIGYAKFQRGPQGLGQLCLVLPAERPRTLLLLNRTVYLRIDADTPDGRDPNVDIVGIARSLSAAMDARVVQPLAGRVPKFANVAAPPQSRVGESIKVRVTLPAGLAADRVLWDFGADADPAVIDQRGVEGSEAELRILKPGRAEVPFFVADRRTLLSSESRVAIDAK